MMTRELNREAIIFASYLEELINLERMVIEDPENTTLLEQLDAMERFMDSLSDKLEIVDLIFIATDMDNQELWEYIIDNKDLHNSFMNTTVLEHMVSLKNPMVDYLLSKSNYAPELDIDGNMMSLLDIMQGKPNILTCMGQNDSDSDISYSN
jgi:hypothetical protein